MNLSPTMTITEDLERRFWSKVTLGHEGGCWEWDGAHIPSGYASISSAANRRQVAVHRLAYTLLVGEIPDGMHIHHRCQNPGCVNPLHLEVVTPKEHRHRHLKDCCPSGHPYTPENTRYINGKRRCKTCANRVFKKWYDKHRRSKNHPRDWTHCKRGHERNEKNTYVMPSGSLMCRVCARVTKAAYKARKRAEKVCA